jgi:hypothetical protein
MLAGLVVSALSQLGPSALDSSSGALSAATTTVTIGTAGTAGLDFWNAIPSAPTSYPCVVVGSKLSFQYNAACI